MATLYRYFKDLWKLAVVALVLAAINQIFSLLDPLIFRHIIDSYVFGPLQELGNVVNAYRETEASLDNFEETLKMPTEQKPEHPVALPSLETLEFDRVSFQHQSASSPALSEISFRVARGETIALVGPSGAGN